MDHIVDFAGTDDHVDRFGLEEVKGFAVAGELFLLYAEQDGVVHFIMCLNYYLRSFHWD